MMITTISIAVVTWVILLPPLKLGDFPAFFFYKGTDVLHIMCLNIRIDVESSPQESGETSGHKL